MKKKFKFNIILLLILLSLGYYFLTQTQSYSFTLQINNKQVDEALIKFSQSEINIDIKNLEKELEFLVEEEGETLKYNEIEVKITKGECTLDGEFCVKTVDNTVNAKELVNRFGSETFAQQLGLNDSLASSLRFPDTKDIQQEEVQVRSGLIVQKADGKYENTNLENLLLSQGLRITVDYLYYNGRVLVYNHFLENNEFLEYEILQEKIFNSRVRSGDFLLLGNINLENSKIIKCTADNNNRFVFVENESATFSIPYLVTDCEIEDMDESRVVLVLPKLKQVDEEIIITAIEKHSNMELEKL